MIPLNPPSSPPQKRRIERIRPRAFPKPLNCQSKSRRSTMGWSSPHWDRIERRTVSQSASVQGRRMTFPVSLSIVMKPNLASNPLVRKGRFSCEAPRFEAQ